MDSNTKVVLVVVSICILISKTSQAEQSLSSNVEAKNNSLSPIDQQINKTSSNNSYKSPPLQAPVNPLQADPSPSSSSPSEGLKIGLEPRISDHNFVKDIVERLHALDADIGKLVYNSTSMYAPNDANDIGQDTSKGGERFTEVLVDLDSLQDEVS